MTPWRNRPTTARTANQAPMEPNTFNPSEKTTHLGKCVPAETRHNAKRNSLGRCGGMRLPFVANVAPLAVRRPTGDKIERQQSSRTLLINSLHVHTIKANARCVNGAHVLSTSRTDGLNCGRQRQFLEHLRSFPQHCHGCLQDFRVVQTDTDHLIGALEIPTTVVEQINCPHKFVSSQTLCSVVDATTLTELLKPSCFARNGSLQVHAKPSLESSSRSILRWWHSNC